MNILSLFSLLRQILPGKRFSSQNRSTSIVSIHSVRLPYIVPTCYGTVGYVSVITPVPEHTKMELRTVRHCFNVCEQCIASSCGKNDNSVAVNEFNGWRGEAIWMRKAKCNYSAIIAQWAALNTTFRSQQYATHLHQRPLTLGSIMNLVL